MIHHKIQAEQIKKTIDASSSILLIAHKKPDGDTLGSVCAWINVLEAKGKQVSAFCLDPVPATQKHLHGNHKLTSDPHIFDTHFDCIIVNDSGDLAYAGVDTLLANRDASRTTLINIDHHQTNPNYGDINLVIETASSTTEIISRLLLYWNEPLSKQVAECLLNGIITDTNSMTNPATNYTALMIASELVRAGADLHALTRHSLYTKSISDLRIWGIVLSRLRLHASLGIVSTYVRREDFIATNARLESVEGITNYLMLIPGVAAVLMLHEYDDGHIKGSLRSISDSVDVSKLAKIFGGGGHRKASGFKIKGKLKIENTVWTIV